VCGVAVGVDDVVENTKAVNLRCFEGVGWIGIETYKHRGSREEPEYVVPEHHMDGKNSRTANEEQEKEIQEIEEYMKKQNAIYKQ
jgi:hypothetical protein